VNFLPVYLDASAIVKLVVHEAETVALLAALERWPDRVSSDVARVEVHRAMWRAGASKTVRARADDVLNSLVLIRTDEPVLRRASSFSEPMLRSLDAIHLAAALSIGDDPDAFIVYDARLARAASKRKLRVLHPGVTKLA
jgi:predicted nucleic acid-binding protein